MFKHLTQTQRYYICLQNARGITQTEIARAIKVDKSTVSREIKRNMRDIQRALEDIYLNSIIPIRTLTSDNGTEFANHKAISANIGCEFYFARQYCSGDRGLGENTNCLVRRVVLKGTNIDTIMEDTVSVIENDLNNRPRKSLGFKTPNEIIDKYLQRVSANLERRKKQLLHFNL